MALPLSIALRFLFRTARNKPVRLFSAVSIAGIAFSVFLFMLVDVIINGLSSHLKQSLIGFDAPLTLEIGREDEVDVHEHLDDLKNKFDGLNYFLVTEFDGLIQSTGDSNSVVVTRAVDANYFSSKRSQFEVLWFEGFNEENFLNTDNTILVGESLYERFRFMPGLQQLVILTHPFAALGPSGEIEPVQKSFEVAGIFHTGRDDFDDAYVLVSPKALSSLGEESFFSKKYFVTLNHLQQTQEITDYWKKAFNNSPEMLSWKDKNQALLKAMQLEKILYLFVLLLVVVISSFNLAGVVAIFTASKALDSAILRTMGLSDSNVSTVFVSIGVMLGGFGVVIGLTLALLTVCVFQLTHFSLPEAYGFTELPLHVNYITVICLLFFTPILTSLVALLPASRLVKKSISEVLRIS